jgi:hypothetical protein
MWPVISRGFFAPETIARALDAPLPDAVAESLLMRIKHAPKGAHLLFEQVRIGAPLVDVGILSHAR